MESLIDRWAQMRRWERGLVLANLCYFLLLIWGHILVHPYYGEYMDLSGFRILFVPFLGITTEAYLLPIACVYYGVWCISCALLVQQLGEKTGTIAWSLAMVVLWLIILLYYTLATFSVSFPA